MAIILSNATFAALMIASEDKAVKRALYLTQTSDGELVYSPIKNTLGAWGVECRANDGTLVYFEMPADV